MNIFIAFANQDRDVRDKLLRQMNLVAARQGWNIWSAKEIKAGEKWDEEIKQRLIDSEVVILLLSADFFASKYIFEKELPEVIAKHQSGQCQIIPVIARVCHWKETPFGEYAALGDIQALPAGEKPIISNRHWDNEDEPYFETVQGIREAIQTFQAKKKATEQALLNASARQAQAAEAAAQLAERERLAAEKRQQEAAVVQQAREARAHAQEQKKRNAPPIPWGLYAGIGGGVLVMALILWWAFGQHETKTDDAVNQNANVDTIVYDKAAPLEKPKQELPTLSDRPISSQPIDVPKPSDPFEGQMVRVVGGAFTMGSTVEENGRYDNECQHSVTIRTFFMSKFEVTQAQWKEIMGSYPSGHKGCDQCPVENVSWDDIQAFLRKLNKQTGKKYRLPTEAEWEYAAKGGQKSTSYKLYAGSNALGNVGWYKDNSGSKTHPVGGKSPNDLGLYDMSGNVWEWCEDDWQSYPCDKKIYLKSDLRVRRGGSVFDSALLCRTSTRFNDGASFRLGYLGFRLASVSLK